MGKRLLLANSTERMDETERKATTRLHLVPKPTEKPKVNQSYVVDMDCRFVRKCLWLAILIDEGDLNCVDCPDRDHAETTS
jgi:hypothetical protein